ncbi:MAG TPA: hypothetical protein VKE94_24655 [Gemmataceae bacterium]|nr:hypothetical protein [Gemmataceae bacterium]
MASDIRIIPVREFYRTDATGKFDKASTRRALQEIAAACVARANHYVLIDTRQADGTALSAADVFELATGLEELGFKRPFKIAIVNQPKDDFDRAAFFEDCATNRGFPTKAFRDFEAAVMWLSAGEPAKP